MCVCSPHLLLLLQGATPKPGLFLLFVGLGRSHSGSAQDGEGNQKQIKTKVNKCLHTIERSRQEGGGNKERKGEQNKIKNKRLAPWCENGRGEGS